MAEVTFCEAVEDSRLALAVIVARSHGKWVFCRHQDRETYECPGGHKEAGETIEETARRELWEETGAASYTLRPVCAYGVADGGKKSFGMLYYAEIESFDEPPASEIREVRLFDALPERWTYPDIQPRLLHMAMDAADLDSVWDLFTKEFPQSLRRPYEGQKALLADPRYGFRVVREHDVPLGFIGYWDLGGFLFVEHVAVYPRSRGKGTGGKMIQDVINLGKPVVLECELPDTKENQIRILWYEKLGFTVNPYDYLQPAFVPECSPVPLALLSTEPLSEIEFEAVRDKLYQIVYKL